MSRTDLMGMEMTKLNRQSRIGGIEYDLHGKRGAHYGLQLMTAKTNGDRVYSIVDQKRGDMPTTLKGNRVVVINTAGEVVEIR